MLELIVCTFKHIFILSDEDLKQLMLKDSAFGPQALEERTFLTLNYDLLGLLEIFHSS